MKNEELDTDELLETNKNLSKSVETMTLRIKVQEEKLQKLKIYKQFYKNSSGFKCLVCSSIVSNQQFLKHVSKCNENHKSNNSINLTKSNISISNIDSHKKTLNDYKASIRENTANNQKKHQSMHYDNEFTQKNTSKSVFDLYETGEIQIELEEIMVNQEQKFSSEFIVRCSCQKNFVWKIQKKYINFCELYQNVSLAFPGLTLPESCKIFTNSNNSNVFNYQGDILKEKQNALQNFIQDLAKIDFIKNSIYFKNFLEVQENLINYLKKEKAGSLRKHYLGSYAKNSNLDCFFYFFF